jgi:hypothetical protein
LPNILIPPNRASTSARLNTIPFGAILAALANGKEFTLKDFFAAIRKTMKSKFDGSISWYTTVVKLDLEARKLVVRVPNSKPHRVRLK